MNSNKKTVKKNYIYNLIYQIAVMIVPLITTPYISRVLEPTGIGIYSFTTSVSSYFVLIGNFGMATYGQLCIAAERDNRKKMTQEFWGIYIARMLMMAICTGFYAVYILFQKQYTLMYWVLIIQLIASAFDISWFFQGVEEFKKITTRNLLVKFAGVILTFLLVKNKNDLYIYAIIMQASVLIGNISIYAYLKKFLTKINLKTIKIFLHIKQSFKYFIPTIATSIYTLLDKSMIGWITHSEVENGYYEQAQKIEQMAVTVVTSLSTVTLPRMAFLFKKNKIDEIKNRLHLSIKFIIWISFPMAAGLIGISNSLIPWFLGKGYDKSIKLLCIFSVLIIIIGLNNAVGKQILMPTGKQKEYNISVICGAIINFICNCILIPTFKSTGAAIASVVAETVILLMFIKFSNNYITLKNIIIYSLKNFIAALFMGIITYIICNHLSANFLSIIIEIIVGIILYIGILFILKDEFTIDTSKKYILKLKNKIKN